MHSNPGAVAGAALLLMLLAACQPVPTGSPSVTVSPVATGPAPVCTAAPGATPTPCTAEQQAAQQAEQQKQDALYREAERVYRAFLAEDEKISRAGSLMTPEMKDLLGGPMVASFASVYERHKAQNIRVVGGEYVLKYIRPAPGKTYPETVVAMESCVDGTTVETYSGSKKIGNGRAVHVFTFYSNADGPLKLWHQEGTVGDTC